MNVETKLTDLLFVCSVWFDWSQFDGFIIGWVPPVQKITIVLHGDTIKRLILLRMAQNYTEHTARNKHDIHACK